MKGLLILELFGEDIRQLAKIYRGIFTVSGGDFGRDLFDQHIGVPSPSSWVAEICGPDEKYGLQRSFLSGKKHYKCANGKGSRGIMVEYVLDPGKIYEVKSQETWGRAERYFCTVDEAGEICVIDEATACHAVGALTREERREKRRAEKLLGD